MAKKKKDCSRYIKKTISNHRFGLQRRVETGFVEDRKEIEKLIEENDFGAAKVIPGYLMTLGECYAIRGIVALIDGEENGWPDIDYSLMLQYWQLRFSIGVTFTAIHQGTIHDFLTLYHAVPDIASLLCCVYVHEQVAIRDEFWGLFQKIFATREAVTGGYWEDEEMGMYELFVFRMFVAGPFAEEAKTPSFLENKAIGPYKGVLDRWDDSKSLANPLIGICDYHCRSMHHDSARDPYPPFRSTPFSLVPYEILAIYKLREELGLETPEIDHPLLALPTASREPRKINKIDDPLFPRLQKLYDEQCQYPWPLR